MPNTGQRARTSLLFSQIPINCFTWEPFKDSLIVSSPSLILRELSNLHLVTRGESLAVRAKKHVGTVRQSSARLQYVQRNYKPKPLVPSLSHRSPFFPAVFGQISRSPLPLFPEFSKLVKAPKANQPPAKDSSLFAEFPPPRSAPFLHFLKTLLTLRVLF